MLSALLAPRVLHNIASFFYVFKIVEQTTLSVVDDEEVYHQTVTFPEQGTFTAALSVADKNIESRVYWSKRTLRIDVVANITELQNTVTNLTNFTDTLWRMYQDLFQEYGELRSQVNRLLTGNWKNIINRTLV